MKFRRFYDDSGYWDSEPRPRTVPLMDRETRDILQSLEGRLDGVDVVRAEKGKILVLGTEASPWRLADRYHEISLNRETGELSETSFKRVTVPEGVATVLTLGLYWLLAPNLRKRVRRQNEYDRKMRDFRDANWRETVEKADSVRVYQGGIEEVERETGRQLERVDTGKPETFIRGDDTLWLRIRAYQQGADAVVHCQPGSSIGTPVRYVDRKD
ncbi:MAG: hypothetical protein HYW25_05705 [Candidatus Aenigmarchaeota archaeon]|nr:hypothetical protein [Candidatus Aenigmarchaeota archaeon]